MRRPSVSLSSGSEQSLAAYFSYQENMLESPRKEDITMGMLETGKLSTVLDPFPL